MYGAILGDIIGSPYEFDQGNKTKDFLLFTSDCEFTDDTVMTLAVAQGFMDVSADADDETVRKSLVRAMHEVGERYPDASWGARFGAWLFMEGAEPYNSYGNGSAMRVSSVAWLFDDLESVRRAARLSAEVTHNHPEGIKGAESVAAAIYLARTGYRKDEIKEYIVREFGYDLSRTCDEIRPNYHHVESCQKTVPEAITAFMEGNSFEDVIRTAVSLGGDCDTLTAIAGSIAEGFYGVPEELKAECREYLSHDLLAILDRFDGKVKQLSELSEANYKEKISRLAILLKAAEVSKDTALNISLMVRKPGKQERMINWLEQNPSATVIEICEKAREIHKAQV